jgi:hypothetical protein
MAPAAADFMEEVALAPLRLAEVSATVVEVNTRLWDETVAPCDLVGGVASPFGRKAKQPSRTCRFP